MNKNIFSLRSNHMESPFAENNSTFVLYLEPVRNNYHKTYQNIITVSTMPPGPLAQLVKPHSLDKLSPFQQAGPFYGGMNCAHVLLRYPKTSSANSNKHGDSFMMAEDIPAVLSYLRNNHYIVDTDMTKMMFKSRIPMSGVSENRMSGDRRMICMVNYPLSM